MEKYRHSGHQQHPDRGRPEWPQRDPRRSRYRYRTHVERILELNRPLRLVPLLSPHHKPVRGSRKTIHQVCADLGSGRTEILRRMRAIAAQEIELARRQFLLARQNSTIGFEASNHYFYTPLDLVEKVLNCRDIIARIT